MQGYGIPSPPSAEPHHIQLYLHPTTPDPYPRPRIHQAPYPLTLSTPVPLPLPNPTLPLSTSTPSSYIDTAAWSTHEKETPKSQYVLYLWMDQGYPHVDENMDSWKFT